MMMKRISLAVLLAAAACSKQPALNYRHCLKLRIGMTREQVFAAMGQPEETFPYVEGKSLPHLKGRTAYEWSTPATMPAANRVSFQDPPGTVESIRCGDSVVSAAVYVEPPALAGSTDLAVGSLPVAVSTSAPAAAPAHPRRGPTERSSSSSQSSGRPLTE